MMEIGKVGNSTLSITSDENLIIMYFIKTYLTNNFYKVSLENYNKIFLYKYLY